MAMEEYQEKVTTSPFLYLTLDLPSSPLFQVSTVLFGSMTDSLLFCMLVLLPFYSKVQPGVEARYIAWMHLVVETLPQIKKSSFQ